jgi:hypothetical protein
MTGAAMKAVGFALLVLLGVLLAIGLDRQLGESSNEPFPTSQPTATLGPEGCEPDRDAIQAALNAYHTRNGNWPTADGQPADIDWDKLVPAFLPYIPHTDSNCDWQVDSNPIGTICLAHPC